MDSTQPISEQHKQKILSMRHQLIKENYVLRTSYKGYSFHMYSVSDFERQVSKYMKQRGIYAYIKNINIRKPAVSQTCLMNIIEQVRKTFDHLLCSDGITLRQFEQMQFNRSEVEFSYLYFALDTKKVNIISMFLLLFISIKYKERDLYNSTNYDLS
jgi:hypothetical protein